MTKGAKMAVLERHSMADDARALLLSDEWDGERLLVFEGQADARCATCGLDDHKRGGKMKEGKILP
jgi:hypothetical protein